MNIVFYKIVRESYNKHCMVSIAESLGKIHKVLAILKMK